MNFADLLQHSIQQRTSALTAGFDPVLDGIPSLFLSEASAATTDDDFLYRALFGYYRFVLETIEPVVSSIKPNIAFFEQYGLGGLKALQDILTLCKDLKLPSILDVKRGDIGSTAESYARAYLTGSMIRGKKSVPFEADAITISPFLGFDTLEVFSKACIETGKGMFVLVKTSNPGSRDIQDLSSEGRTTSMRLADWIAENAKPLTGTCGISSLGAVVGATHPKELAELRTRMPASLLLIPGLGAQGGTSKDVVAGFTGHNTGAVINVSRGLLSWEKKDLSKDEMAAILVKRASDFNTSLSEAQKSRNNAL